MTELNQQWENLCSKLSEQFNNEADLTFILFLIGIQELGQGFRKYTKEEKLDLIQIATCKLLSRWDYYKFEGKDNDNWPVWKKTENWF